MIAPSRELSANGLRGSPRDHARPARRGGRVEEAALPSSQWLLRFVSFEFACQLALLFPQLSGMRVLLRSAPFVCSLALLLLRSKKPEYHPARPAAVAIVLILAAAMLHPLTNSPQSGAATVLFNFAIVAPIFWVPRLRINQKSIHDLMLLFWTFQTASAAVGALQVYFPGQFQPATATVFSDEMLSGLRITLADGSRVLRPMGLTDSPGGAGIGGMYSVVFGMALWLDRPKPLFRIVLLLSMVLGLFALYLSQVRSLLVMLVPVFVASTWPQLSRLRFGRAIALVGPLVLTAAVAFVFAVAVGGDTVTNRLSTLIASDPRTVYVTNRGFFLETTFKDMLPQYPVGAGLGRWGMMYRYFGDHRNSASPPIWAEIQWTAWLLDGGVPLMLAGTAAMWIALREAFRVAFSKAPTFRRMAELSGFLLGYNIGLIALTFNACPFAGTLGTDFWLFNAAFFAAMVQAKGAKGMDAPDGQAPGGAVVQSWT